MKKHLLLGLALFSFLTINSQNTVGTISIDSDVTDGYTLFTISNGTYLIDNCGQLINSWTSTFPPGNAVYLLEDGSILRAGKTTSTDIPIGGQGGVVEKFDWDGNLTWQYFYDTIDKRQHHDVYPMPNGNVLILAITIMPQAEAIQAGRDPNLISSSARIYNEQIIEVTPDGLSNGNIVWEWNIKDHLIQDFDPAKDNYGSVELSPNKLDFNYTANGSSQNWLHINSIQYDETLNQIIVNSRNLGEMYIIDHTTTTAEAATGTGGTYGKGGDILYRWGNPQVYRQGNASDQKLFGQHYPRYIRSNPTDDGKIIVFNNGNGRTPEFSEVYIIDPPVSLPGVYTKTPNVAYGPTTIDYIYAAPNPGDFFSSFISGAQRLPNGNTLIMEGAKGKIFEVDPSDTILWEYIIPVSSSDGSISSQGVDPTLTQRFSFRARKYLTNYAAFDGRDLSNPDPPIENNPNIAACLSTLDNSEFMITDVAFYPNPVIDFLNINSNVEINKIELFGLSGNKISEELNTDRINLSTLSSGIYFIKVYSADRILSKKILKK